MENLENLVNLKNIAGGNGVNPAKNERTIGAIVTPNTVLIVDDEPDIVEEVVEQLDHEGLHCVFAFNAAQAIEMVGADPSIGVIVTDIRMPGMDGLEMARKLKDEAGSLRDLYIIVVTGHAGMAEAIEALQLGAEDFLTKPISPDHLLHSVRRAKEMVQLRSNDRLFQVHLEQQVREKTAKIRSLADDLAGQNRLLEQKNQDLTVVNRLKDEFLQMMSHELNTPLNAIVGFAQLLKANLNNKGDEKGEKCAEHILTAGTRLADVVDSILTLSDISAGNLSLELGHFSAINLADSITSEYTPLLASWNAQLRSDLPDRPIDLKADFELLRKAVGHLIENAAKYGSQGGQVSMALVMDGDEARISVSDDGPGMTGSQISAALEPLRQVDGSMSRKHEGMGLGLPIAKGIAELHGGRLEIQSTPGTGTTVTIFLPQGA